MFSFTSSSQATDEKWFIAPIREYTNDDGILDLTGVLMRHNVLTKDWKNYCDPDKFEDFCSAIDELKEIMSNFPELSDETIEICNTFLSDTEAIDSLEKIEGSLNSAVSELNNKFCEINVVECINRLSDDYTSLVTHLMENDISFVCDDLTKLRDLVLPSVQLFDTAIREQKFKFAYSMLINEWVTPKKIVRDCPDILTKHVLSESIINFIFDDSTILNFTLTKFIDLSKNYSVDSWLTLLKNCSHTLLTSNIYAQYRIKSELDSIFDLHLTKENLYNEACLNVRKKINEDFNESLAFWKQLGIVSCLTFAAAFMSS